MVKDRAVRQDQLELSLAAVRFPARVADRPREEQVLLLGDPEFDLDRVHLRHNSQQRRFGAADERADLRLRHAGQTHNGARDARVAEVELGGAQVGARRVHLPLGSLLRRDGMIEVLPADGVALDERPQPADVGVGLGEPRLSLGERGARLGDRGLVLLWIELLRGARRASPACPPDMPAP